ncbi:hypothetical protein [Sphingobium sp. TomTYG45]
MTKWEAIYGMWSTTPSWRAVIGLVALAFIVALPAVATILFALARI